MRWIILVVLAGCASSQGLETATRNAQACEYRHEQVQADAERLNASSDYQQAANARAWADKIALDCKLWRDQVAVEQAKIDTAHTNRMAAAGVIKGWGDGLGGAADVYRTPKPPTYDCHSNYIGGMECSPR